MISNFLPTTLWPKILIKRCESQLINWHQCCLPFQYNVMDDSNNHAKSSWVCGRGDNFVTRSYMTEKEKIKETSTKVCDGMHHCGPQSLRWTVVIITVITTELTWGNVPFTSSGMSSFVYPTALRPLSTLRSNMNCLSVSDNTWPASSRFLLRMSAPEMARDSHRSANPLKRIKKSFPNLVCAHIWIWKSILETHWNHIQIEGFYLIFLPPQGACQDTSGKWSWRQTVPSTPQTAHVAAAKKKKVCLTMGTVSISQRNLSGERNLMSKVILRRTSTTYNNGMSVWVILCSEVLHLSGNCVRQTVAEK